MNLASRKRQEAGTSLIEVLVAAIVMAFGLLGLAAMQARGMQNTQSADFRSQATVLAYDMSDRMLANLAGWREGDYDAPTGANNGCSGSKATACTASQLAAHDMYEWTSLLAATLPDGQGTVCIDSTADDGADGNADGSVAGSEAACDGAGGNYVIKLWWRDERDNPNADLQRLVTVLTP